MAKIVVADPMHPVGIDLLKEKFEVVSIAQGDADAAPSHIADADGVIVRTFRISEDLLAQAPILKAIVKHGAGMDNIPVAAALRRGIVVANTGDSNSMAVAEATVTMILAALRRTPAMHRLVEQGRYSARWHIILGDISNKVLGLIGFGSIGRKVAHMCKGGFGCEVLVFDPFVSRAEIESHDMRKADDIGEIFSGADIVSLHLPYNADTHHIVDRAELKLMKPSAVLINVSRGGLINEDALHEALVRDSIFCAGLDVFETEPPARDHPLFGLDNVVFSPHIGGATLGSRQLTSTYAAQAIIDVIEGRRPRFPVAR